MFINFKVLKDNSISHNDMLILIAISQLNVNPYLKGNFFDIFGVDVKDINNEYISGGKLTKQGKELLTKIEKPDYDENAEKLAIWLIDYYKSEGKATCSRKVLIELILWFVGETKIIYSDLHRYIQDYLNSDEGKYNHKLEYLFFKPENVYSKKRNLELSRLYNWIINNVGDYVD